MVLITGGAQGLGSSIACIFARNNNDIVLTYLTNEEKALKLGKEIKDKYNVKCIVKKLDITCENDVKKIFNEHSIDIVINNASFSNDNYIENKSFDEFMDVVKVNLGGTYLVCKYAKGAKYIINISSTDGINTYSPISLDYSASKAGIINLSKNLSLYYRDKKIYCVCPNWINTESVLSMNQEYLESELKRIGQNELLDKDYVAKEIYKLIDSDKISGSVVIIDEER